MAWVITAGESPVQGPQGIVTTVTGVNGVKTITVDLANDGTKPGLEAAVRSYLANRNASGVVAVVAPGTVLDISPLPGPQPPSQAELDRAAYFAGKAKVQTLKELLALGRTGVTQQMLTDATTAWNALPFVAGYEGV